MKDMEILLVEDTESDVELTLYAFKKNNLTNKIHVARDGEQALAFLFCNGAYANRSAEDLPGLVLLDLKLPKIDGLEVLKQIKSDPRIRTIAVVMLTSSGEEKDIIESYQLGVNSYIVKPVEFGKFTEAVARLGMYWLLLNQPSPAVRTN